MTPKNQPFKLKTQVYWKWLGRKIEGRIVEIFFEPVTKNIKNKNIKRNGSKECPAYLVQAESGNFALKLHTELFALERVEVKRSKPSMF